MSSPIPVTLMSGFLGAGKTTVLNYVLDNKKRLRVAVLVNDMSSVNVDAELVKRVDEKVVELSNGCICCTLREDLIDQLLELGRSDEGKAKYDLVLIESSGISEPIHVAETFLHAETLDKAKDFSKLVRLDCTVTVVDASTFLELFSSGGKESAAVSALTKSEKEGEGEGEEDRTVMDLLLDQVQFADVILLSKTDLVTATQLEAIGSILTDLNPLAKMHTIAHGVVDLDWILNTRLFSFEKAAANSQWFEEEWGESTPESEEYDIGSFVFTARRPFHPQRLHTLLESRKALGEVVSAERDRAKKRKRGTGGADFSDMEHRAFSRCIRAKGFIWLATRHDNSILLHLAGGSVKFTLGQKWWSTRRKATWPKDADFKREILDEMVEPFGDRVQTLVVIGVRLDKKRCEEELRACLLTEEELAAGDKAWASSMAPEPFAVEI